MSLLNFSALDTKRNTEKRLRGRVLNPSNLVKWRICGAAGRWALSHRWNKAWWPAGWKRAAATSRSGTARSGVSHCLHADLKQAPSWMIPLRSHSALRRVFKTVTLTLPLTLRRALVEGLWGNLRNCYGDGDFGVVESRISESIPSKMTQRRKKINAR